MGDASRLASNAFFRLTNLSASILSVITIMLRTAQANKFPTNFFIIQTIFGFSITVFYGIHKTIDKRNNIRLRERR